MKKLLSILGTITIAGSGIAGLVGNAPAPEKNNINYQQTNNLETLHRVKQGNTNSQISGILKIAYYGTFRDRNWNILIPDEMFIWNNKLYFQFKNLEEIYEYDQKTKIVTIKLKNKVYEDLNKHSWDNINKNDKEKISLYNKEYYIKSDDKNVYEKNKDHNTEKKIINDHMISNNGIILNNKIYYLSENGKFYEYEPLELIESDIINLQEQIRRGLYLYYHKKNPNFFIKNIEFNMNNLNYSDIELIKEEELPTQKVTEDICVGETEFENALSTEQKFKTQSCKYTKQKINSIQIIKGINKRIDNTLETGTSTTDATSKTDTKTKTNTFNAGVEVSAGWGPISGSVSTSVGNEESNTSQRENSQAKTKNISTIISDSSSFDLSNLKEEQQIETNELEYPAQEITVGGNQTIKVIFNLNKIIKKYKITFKQNISGKIKAKIKNEINQIIEQEFSIKNIMLSLKENNLLPQEITINNDSVSFLGELIVSKNSSQLKLKAEEIETI